MNSETLERDEQKVIAGEHYAQRGREAKPEVDLVTKHEWEHDKERK